MIENLSHIARVFIALLIALPSVTACVCRSIFTATVSINGIFLARSIGQNKKELKHHIYSKAYDVLTKKTVADINDLTDPGKDFIR